VLRPAGSALDTGAAGGGRAQGLHDDDRLPLVACFTQQVSAVVEPQSSWNVELHERKPQALGRHARSLLPALR
jgi:hypothetical protein